jgi:histidine triad (HIT) family protein
MENCIFCKIIKGKIPAEKIYENDYVMGFLDISPVNKGHALIIPKKHSETILDTDEETLKEVMIITKKLSAAIMKAIKADGFEVCINNKKAAGQLVPHLHMHIMPRFNNDGLRFDWPTKKYSDEEMKKIAESIKKAL